MDIRSGGARPRKERRFYRSYQIQQTVFAKLSWSHYCELLTISGSDKRSIHDVVLASQTTQG